jgi:hypothetical protein
MNHIWYTFHLFTEQYKLLQTSVPLSKESIPDEKVYAMTVLVKAIKKDLTYCFYPPLLDDTSIRNVESLLYNQSMQSHPSDYDAIFTNPSSSLFETVHIYRNRIIHNEISLKNGSEELRNLFSICNQYVTRFLVNNLKSYIKDHAEMNVQYFEGFRKLLSQKKTIDL